MTEEEHAAIVREETQRVHDRLRPILQHRQGKALDPLARHLAFSTSATRVEAIQILAAARGCLDEMVEAELARRAQADIHHRQQLVESAANIVPMRRATSD
jgi:hypothetical protein